MTRPEARELLHRDALSAYRCGLTPDQWRADVPQHWVEAVPGREVAALIAYVWRERGVEQARDLAFREKWW